MYKYEIDGIDWPEGSSHELPDMAIVGIPNSVVLDDDEDEFEACVIEALAEQFGIKPLSVGGFGPYEDDDDVEEETEM